MPTQTALRAAAAAAVLDDNSGAEFETLEEFSRVMKWSDKTTYRLIAGDPTFPAVKVRGLWRIHKARSRKWLARRAQGAK